MIVVDVNVVLSGLRSRNGASHLVLTGMLFGALPFCASTPVLLEYEDVLKRPGLLGPRPWISEDEIDAILDLLCERAVPADSFFRFRPFLDDPKDDLYVECAFAGGAAAIVTGDRHFRRPALAAFGITVLTPQELIVHSGLWRQNP